jgi:hypothetical protein
MVLFHNLYLLRDFLGRMVLEIIPFAVHPLVEAAIHI